MSSWASGRAVEQRHRLDSGHQEAGLPRPAILSPLPDQCDVLPRVLAGGGGWGGGQKS